MSFGNSYVKNMESALQEYWKSMQWTTKSKIEKMYFSIKQTMIIMYQEHCLLIYNQGLSMAYKTVLILNFIIHKIFLCPKKEAGLVIIGLVDTPKDKNSKNKLWIWLIDKQMVQIALKDL